jgi:CMP/dCMP kinase
MAPRVVAIDGAAGSGKSTLARSLARALRLAYVNTGTMYRALAAAAVRSKISPDDPAPLMELIDSLRFTLSAMEPRELEVDGYTENELTGLDVETTVPTVARHPVVRRRMAKLQRELGAPGAVMEGRDIARVVFPDAPVKLYLTADPSIRAARRAGERSTDASVDRSVVADALRSRDELDAMTNPFERPDGAEVIDTGRLGIEQALAFALKIVAERAPWLLADGEA